MTWVLVIGVGWVLLAALVAVVIGRGVRLADRQAAGESSADEPNFVVDPATAPRGMPAATILPFPATSPEAEAKPVPRPVRDTPTVPGIPVARPPAPGAGNGGSKSDPVRKTGLG
jgi:hypothetical protein